MPRLSLLPTLAREIVLRKHQSRIPEPMVMDEADQVDAFAEAGRIDGIMGASYLFQTARICQVIQGCNRIVDLGCGPASQLGQIAALNPGISFLGLDLSESMLESGRHHLANLGVSNVELEIGDITDLSSFADHTVDGFISTMTLHQLPDFSMLEACFREVGRTLKPDGTLYFVDFGRLKSPKSIRFFAYLNADNQPEAFTEDYRHSLHAAFLADEYKDLTRRWLPAHIKVLTTFLVPMLTIVKSPDRPLPSATSERLREMRAALPARYRHELDDIRVFTRLGGLANDPFAAPRP